MAADAFAKALYGTHPYSRKVRGTIAAVAEPLLLQGVGSELTAVAVGLLVVQALLASVVLSLGFRSAASPRASGARSVG